MNKILLCCLATMLLSLSTACGNDDNTNKQQKTDPDPVIATFVKGADISWLTEMEHDGKKFYDSKGNEKECTALMKELGFEAVRLRVWVDPTGGWCGKADVLKKALRAKDLGMPVMIDFHYSDTWADPSNQSVPKAWAGHDVGQLSDDITAHTTDVLNTLKENGVDVKWVQMGNETTSGMLWPAGKASGQDFAGYVALNNTAYTAIKSVYPEALCIIHLDRGDTNIDLQKPDYNHLTWMFDGLKKNHAKWDIIGLSIYPDDSNWTTSVAQCLDNINTLYERYSTKVMICEIGMPWDSSNASAVMQNMVNGCKNNENCAGIFYWEPEVYGGWKPAAYEALGWNAYTKGAFDNNGKPTAALNAFK